MLVYSSILSTNYFAEVEQIGFDPSHLVCNLISTLFRRLIPISLA